MSAAAWIGVGVLGALGALMRFAVDGAIAGLLGGDFPFGTLVVNLSGALVLGLITGLAPSSDASLLLGTAAVGSYTTFSTWMFETHRLVEDGEPGNAVANVVVSLVLGFALAALGRTLGAHL